MDMTYIPQGVCTKSIQIEIEAGILRQVKFGKGICPGNGQAVATLVRGLPVTEVVAKLKGIRCGKNPTSCPDQLAKALEKAIGMRQSA